MKQLVIGLLSASLLVACASQKPKEEPKEEAPAQVVEATKADEPTTESVPETKATEPVAPVAVDPLDDPSSILARRSTYYPFDVYVVQEDDKPLVQAHASYLSEHSNRKVRLEGNCDERGSNEYNLGLGQRRADGVKKMLLIGGAKESQIDTVSYGEERPRETCHAERCWKENRRTDLKYR